MEEQEITQSDIDSATLVIKTYEDRKINKATEELNDFIEKWSKLNGCRIDINNELINGFIKSNLRVVIDK